MIVSGFDWDSGNRHHCQKHGVSIAEIEAFFARPFKVHPDVTHSSDADERFQAIGRGSRGRSIFLVFTIRTRNGERLIRPISARYMHRKEVEHYEKETPGS
jgi:uncharacterized protein